jgi:hypothetical protein
LPIAGKQHHFSFLATKGRTVFEIPARKYLPSAACTLKKHRLWRLHDGKPSSTTAHFKSAPWNVPPTGGNVLSPGRKVLSVPGMNASQTAVPTPGRNDVS